MLSLSDNEFSVLNFLVRNFSEKLTIRNIAQRLNFSPAGVFNILKKLEKQSIVVGQKLGTGLFYSINFENKIAEHLAEIVLLHSDEKIDLLRKKDSQMLQILKKGVVLFGEDKIVEIIKNCISRF